MIKKMTFVRPALFAALLCGVSAIPVLAQDPAATSNPGAPGPLITPPTLLPPSSPPPPPPPPMQHRPNPLFDALDTNHDGVISAEEIANATASLKTLLKNGSDHLTREDLRPAGGPPPPAPGGPSTDEAGGPRPKVGAIRPHNPPPRPEEDAAEPAGRRMHPGAPDDDQADDEADRPQPLHERMREHRRSSRWEDDEMNDNDARPRHPDPMREDREARPHRGPRGEDAGRPDEARPRPPGPMNDEAGPRPPHHGPPPMPLFNALDANHDGVISADEIANASATLKALLKNGSDHLTRDDLRPPAPHGEHPEDRR